ncbi:MAG: HAD family hydrolase [Alcanivorax sp.]
MTHFPETITLPDAVFWDWDGTIADSYGFLNDAHNHTLEALGFERFKDGEYMNYFGKPREVLYPAIYKDKCDQAMDIFQTYVFENSHKVKTIDGTRDVLEFFHTNKIPMGVVTNKKSSFVTRELEHTRFAPFFQVIIGAGEAHSDKPSGAPLALALEKTNLEPQTHNIWFVGDTENDLACAQDAGCTGIFLKGDKDTESLIATYKPLISFDHYQQFKEFLVAI